MAREVQKEENKDGKGSRENRSRDFKRDGRDNRRDAGKGQELKEKVIQIARVTKVVKGGKNISFRAIVVVGDGSGSVGLGKGNSKEVPKAIRKAIENAKKNMIPVRLVNNTIAHDIEGRSDASRVFIRPAPEGTGVIAGGAVRSVLETAGIKDIVAKSLGSKNPINSARAAIDALTKLRDFQLILKLRGQAPRIRKFKPTAVAS